MNEPVRLMSVKPVEQPYYTTVLRTVMEYHRKTYELEETTFFLEYQDANLWFSPEWFEPPIFGKFDFLKDLKCSS